MKSATLLLLTLGASQAVAQVLNVAVVASGSAAVSARSAGSPPVTIPRGSPADDRQLEAARRIVATLQLAADEYRLAWSGGALTNSAEWEEAKLFVAEARRSASLLGPPLSAELDARLADVERRLAARFPPDSMRQEAQAVERRLTSALGLSLDERPSREPSLAAGEQLYRAQCAGCHGIGGKGDGVGAAGLTPPPADLTAPALLASSVPLDYYRKITHGVPGTAMPGYAATLTREERWDVVAHVFALADTAARRGRSGQVAVVFGTVRGTLGGAMDLARGGDREAAGRKVLDAYMAFEAVEASLGATDPDIVARAEAAFSALRAAAEGGAPLPQLEARHATLTGTLAEAEHALVHGRSRAGLFASSLLLMLREGFEAILVIGAIMAVLLKAGANHRLRDVRWGVALALVASLVTAGLIEWLFRITPAQREALEGGIMLVAAAMLFYVSYWLISKVEIAAWTRFVKGQIQRAVESGSGLALAGVAFLAVYREGFETVLFYKALFVSGGAGGAGPIGAGMALGVALLVAVFVGIERFGLKIPMRPFFAVTGATLAYMAFVFAGQGVKELQEGGFVPTSLVPGGPRSDLLGIYPTWESLAVQALILAAIVGGLAWTFVLRPRRLASLPAPSTPATASGPATPPSMAAPSRPSSRNTAGV